MIATEEHSQLLDANHPASELPACSGSNAIWCLSTWLQPSHSKNRTTGPNQTCPSLHSHLLALIRLRNSSYVTAQPGLQNMQIAADTSWSHPTNCTCVLPTTCSHILTFFPWTGHKIIKLTSHLGYQTCFENPATLGSYVNRRQVSQKI